MFTKGCPSFPVPAGDTMSALHVAARYNIPDVLTQMLQSLTRGPFKRTAATTLAALVFTVNTGTSNLGVTALMFAARRGNEDLVRILLQVPNIRANQVCTHGSTALLLPSQNGYEGVVRRLLKHPGCRHRRERRR